MRHDLPKKIQLSAPKTPWYKREAIKQALELLILGACFVVSSQLIQALVR